MASFSADDYDRLDWELLQDSAVTLYWRRALFDEADAWLHSHDYIVHVINCDLIDHFRAEMTRILQFKRNFGYEPWTGNLDALNDALRELDFGNSAGIAFGFLHIDRRMESDSDRDWILGVLDLFERHSRDYLLLGERLICLAQSDDASVCLGPLGGRTPNWNRPLSGVLRLLAAAQVIPPFTTASTNQPHVFSACSKACISTAPPTTSGVR